MALRLATGICDVLKLLIAHFSKTPGTNQTVWETIVAVIEKTNII